MATLWFWIVAVMVTAYVILDGFDLGAGAIHLLVGRSDLERRQLLRSIGPVWDGNEVWLLAAGGTLYFAFPLLYASSFSGFYLPLMMVLWLLMMRGIGIELRNHLEMPLWRSFFDGLFALASTLLCIFLGAALGNVIRGVPLDGSGYFFLPLFTDWRVGPHPGILDWYTVLAGVVALAILTMHGSLYVITKTEAELQGRARQVVKVLWPLVLLLILISLLTTISIRPELLGNYLRYPVAFAIPPIVFACLIAVRVLHSREKEKAAFLASALYIAFMLVGAVFALYPTVLPSSIGDGYSLTIYNTAAARYGLTVGLVWWCIGMVLALGYFVVVYRIFRGKVRVEEGESGY